VIWYGKEVALLQTWRSCCLATLYHSGKSFILLFSKISIRWARYYHRYPGIGGGEVWLIFFSLGFGVQEGLILVCILLKPFFVSSIPRRLGEGSGSRLFFSCI